MQADLVALRKHYLAGENIAALLRQGQTTYGNDYHHILISYDLQSGSYIQHVTENLAPKLESCQAMADILNPLLAQQQITSLLDAGTGEATTLTHLLPRLAYQPERLFAFDLSWSRLMYARKYLTEHDLRTVQLFTGNLLHPPLADNSIDLVFTCHAIEPNGGKEKEILSELFRITRKYLVLFEPGYEFASSEAQARMRSHGYVTRLAATVQELGYTVLSYQPLGGQPLDALNLTAVMIIDKTQHTAMLPPEPVNPLTCPITGQTLQAFEDGYFSPQGLFAYPILRGIPCLLPEQAIVATHFDRV